MRTDLGVLTTCCSRLADRLPWSDLGGMGSTYRIGAKRPVMKRPRDARDILNRDVVNAVRR